MTSTHLSSRALAEFFGTFTLVMVVVGSGIMGQSISQDNGVALLINTISTIFALLLLILTLGKISGAHFNPAVSVVMVLNKNLRGRDLPAYVVSQTIGAILGAVVANGMFNQAWLQISTKARDGFGQYLGEFIATSGLILVILFLLRDGSSEKIFWAVPAWIGSAYFFTSSTSFANPAVTVGRIFSDTFAGIAPASSLMFIFTQLLAAVAAYGAFKLLIGTPTQESK
jgi:glycerol uptake facilitator-like aquaporin